MTSLTFGNPLKFGQDSCHTSKGRYLPPPRERAPEALRGPLAPINREEPPTGPTHVKVSPQQVVERRPTTTIFHSDQGQASTMEEVERWGKGRGVRCSY